MDSSIRAIPAFSRASVPQVRTQPAPQSFSRQWIRHKIEPGARPLSDTIAPRVGLLEHGLGNGLTWRAKHRAHFFASTPSPAAFTFSTDIPEKDVGLLESVWHLKSHRTAASGFLRKRLPVPISEKPGDYPADLWRHVTIVLLLLFGDSPPPVEGPLLSVHRADVFWRPKPPASFGARAVSFTLAPPTQGKKKIGSPGGEPLAFLFCGGHPLAVRNAAMAGPWLPSIDIVPTVQPVSSP